MLQPHLDNQEHCYGCRESAAMRREGETWGIGHAGTKDPRGASACSIPDTAIPYPQEDGHLFSACDKNRFSANSQKRGAPTSHAAVSHTQ